MGRLARTVPETLLLFIVILFFAENFSITNGYEVEYKLVEDFGPEAEKLFEKKHNLVRRAASDLNTTSTSTQPGSPSPTEAPSQTATTTQNSGTPQTAATTQSIVTPQTEGATQAAATSETDATSRASNTKFVTTPTQKPSTTSGPSQNTASTSGVVPTQSPGSTSGTTSGADARTAWTKSPVTPSPSVNSTNSTNVTDIQDNHQYYTSQYFASGEKWWYDLKKGRTPKLHEKLSKNQLYSDTIPTSFKFPFYGHLINKVTITNKGYVFLGERVHKYNASTQYVAPLMANFGADLHNDTTIHYVDTGERFTVEWNNIRLINQTGEFAFQCSIFKNGSIVFAYKNIPLPVNQIRNDSFFVRVGLADSYSITYIRIVPYRIPIIGVTVFYRVRFIVHYLYHRVNLLWSNVRNNSAFVLTPLPNCIILNSCDSCLNTTTTFNCAWCPGLKRCSDGIDRHRQSWIVRGCIKNSIKDKCPKETTTTRPTTRKRTTKAYTATQKYSTTSEASTSIAKKGANEQTKSDGSSSGSKAGYIVAILICLGALLVFLCWFAYAYRHPHSRSGIFLMQYGNPRKWGRHSSREHATTGGIVSFKSMSNESNA